MLSNFIADYEKRITKTLKELFIGILIYFLFYYWFLIYYIFLFLIWFMLING